MLADASRGFAYRRKDALAGKGKDFAFRTSLEYRNGKYCQQHGMAPRGSGIPEYDSIKSPSRSHSWKEILRRFLNNPQSSSFARILNWIMISMAILSVILVCLETVDSPVLLENAGTFYAIEVCLSLAFLGELLLRLASSRSLFFKADPEDRIEDDEEDVPALQSIYNWLDLVSITPLFIEWSINGVERISGNYVGSGDIWSSLRVFKALRVVRLARRLNGMRVLESAVYRSLQPMMLPMFFLFVFTMVFGTCIFALEPCYSRSDCPFTDIFSASYFSIVTMTSVGYGDQVRC